MKSKKRAKQKQEGVEMAKRPICGAKNEG